MNLFRTTIETVRTAPVVLDLHRLSRRRRFFKAVDEQTWWGVYPSFAAASEAVPGSAAKGYDAAAPAGMYRHMLDRLHPRDYPVMFWLGDLFKRGARSVFDFGGHVGVKYYAY